jgi:hypothetical protein
MKKLAVLLVGVAIAIASGSVSAAAGASTKSVNPCSLITEHTVASSLKLKISKRSLAPLGPTCIYSFRGTKHELTIALQNQSLTSVKREIAHRKATKVARHSAYCGKIGQVTLDVSLGRKKLLSVAGTALSLSRSCRVAREIAGTALAKFLQTAR